LALRSGARRLADDATPDVVVLRVQHSDGPRSAEGRVEPKKVTGLREAGGGVEVADAGFGARAIGRFGGEEELQPSGARARSGGHAPKVALGEPSRSAVARAVMRVVAYLNPLVFDTTD
jgi:hypothetical protein